MQDRVVPFERVLNFRDFGGWDVEGGRLKRGVLWRSASFHDACDADLARLDDMGINFLVDLRRPEERTHEPNRWPSEAVRTVYHEDPGVDVTALPPHLQALMNADVDAPAIAGYMREIYKSFPFEQRLIRPYREWFRSLIEEGGPGVIHCAAGKDRTGLGCALTLLALGVDEDTVFADYEFTNKAVDIDARLPRIQANFEKRIGRTLDAATLRPILGVDVDYLRAALDAIEARYGAVENYLEAELGVGPGQRETLRQRLLA